MVFRGHPKQTSNALKWLGFVTAVWVQAISGNNYSFSNYSVALKSIMNLTQLELNILSVAKDLGKAFGLLAGISSDRLPPWLILLIGSMEGLVGYGAQWLVVSKRATLSYWQMCIVVCMGGNSSTWMNTAILVTCLRNFPKNRGPVSGILKGYVGLSTAIFTDVCTALFSDGASAFLLMLAVIPFAVCLTSMVFLREVPPTNDVGEESRYFTAFNSLAVVVAFYLLAYDFTGSQDNIFNSIFVGILLFLLASPLAIPLYDFFIGSRPGRSEIKGENNQEVDEALLISHETAEQGILEAAVAQTPVDHHAAEVKRKPVIGEDHTILEAIRTYDFWLFFASFLCGVGTGIAVQNNMGQIGLALGYQDVSVFVSLISIWGFFGRIISGTGSEYLIKRIGTPRPYWNAASQVVMMVGFIIMALALPGNLYVGSIIVGLSYGVRLAIAVPMASELFGLKYYGLLYNALILNLPLGSFLFSGLLAGLIYDAEATQTASGGNTCSGAHCYRLIFIIMAVASLVGCVLDVLMAIKTKALYLAIQATKNSGKN